MFIYIYECAAETSVILCYIIPGGKKTALKGKNNWSERKCSELYCIVLHELPFSLFMSCDEDTEAVFGR